jgi:hypothetical protein
LKGRNSEKVCSLVLLASLSQLLPLPYKISMPYPALFNILKVNRFLLSKWQEATPAKGFGELPQGLSENQWIGWVAPNENPNNLILTGAKAWEKEGKYIGIACLLTIRPMPGRQKSTRITPVRKTTTTDAPINYISAFSPGRTNSYNRLPARKNH